MLTTYRKLTWVWQMLQALINPAIMLTTSRNRTEWNLNGNIKTWMDNNQKKKTWKQSPAAESTAMRYT